MYYSTEQSAGSNVENSVFIPLAIVRVRLPKLELPKFKGNITKWIPFWDSFKSAIHDNPDMSKVDKFNYLMSLSEGPASKVVQGFSVTEAIYGIAVDLLHERFGNEQSIVSAHMDELLKMFKFSPRSKHIQLSVAMCVL